jgi:hypothetical protein
LTEEEKAARLTELREKLAAKRAGQSEQDKKDKERNDQIRRKATKEQQDIKEDLAKKEQIKEAEAKRREKQADVEAKKRIQAKIAADKEERRLKSEREKAARAGQPAVVHPPRSPLCPRLLETTQRQDYDSRLLLARFKRHSLSIRPSSRLPKPLARSLVFKSPSLSKTSPRKSTTAQTLAKH